MMKLEEIGTRARQAEPVLRIMETEKKNRVLKKAAENLVADAETIIAANALDMEHGKEKGMSQGLLDRLFLDKSRIEAMAEGMCQVSELDDPIGEVLGMKKRPNGLLIGQKRVPLGVVGIIYEARPNVTADAFALCFKTGNVVILKGGSDAIHSNTAIVASLRKTLKEEQVPEDALLLIEDTSRETTAQFMKMNRYVDVLIPRGGAGLIRAVVENSTIPVIETGTGNCHIYVDETADLSMAVDIILNAKTQRVGVCNACESIVVHENVREKLLPVLEERLKEKHVEMRADEKAREYMPEAEEATEEDWGKEYLDYIRTKTITFGMGPAGTGKTYLAMAMAVAALNRKEVGRILLTRPVVEAGENLGFLPGTLTEKIDPYIRPLYDALFDMMDPVRANKLLSLIHI